jgi:hypothetical protein
MKYLNKLILALGCPLFIGSFAWADTLNGEIQQAGSTDPSHALKTGLHANQTQLYSAEFRVLANPTPSEHCMNVPYYVPADHTPTGPWDQWWWNLSLRIEKNFDRNVQEFCEMRFDVVITADGKIKADYVGAPSADPAIERMSHVIESLWVTPDGLTFPPLAFPPGGSSREVVWMEIFLSKHLGPYGTSGEPKCIIGGGTVHPVKTDVKSGSIHPK